MNEIEKKLAEELAQHMNIGMGDEDVMTFLSQTGQREGWMWQTLISIRAKLAALESRAISLGYTKDQRDKLFGSD